MISFDFFKFFSISSIVHKHRGKYYKAFKDTEDNGSDLTYFIITQLDITLESITIVVDKLMAKLQKELLKEELIKGGIVLSDRQEKFLKFMDGKDNNLATIKGYQKQLKVSYETGRRELSELVQLGLFRKAKKGREFIYKYVGAKGYFSK